MFACKVVWLVESEGTAQVMIFKAVFSRVVGFWV